MGASREALSAAVAEQRSLEGGARETAENVETYAQVRWACSCCGWSHYQSFAAAEHATSSHCAHACF